MARIVLHTFRGNRYTVHELADMSGVPAVTIYQRLSNGWSIEQALCIPTPAQRRREVVSNLIAIRETRLAPSLQESANISFQDEDDF